MQSICLNTIYILFQRSWCICSFSALPPKEGRDYTSMQDLGIKILAWILSFGVLTMSAYDGWACSIEKTQSSGWEISDTVKGNI
jgi:hypothetical protein